MAVGTMVLQNRSFVNVSGPPVTLTLNNAPAKDALMALARLGGYGFVFLGQEAANSNGVSEGGDSDPSVKLVSLAFQEENYAKAFNSVLLAAGLKGRIDGKTVFVGSQLANVSFSPSVSKVYRLNQVTADAAAQYLASLGAKVCVPTTTTFNSSNSSTEGTASASSSQTQSSSSTKTEISCYGGNQGEKKSGHLALKGPLLGLEGTTDGRLSTVTLVGESRLVAVAEAYLKNLDLRKRQVAVKVQILNIDLTNDKSIDASFSARLGNTFIVSESGKAFMNFGEYRPGNSAGTGLLGRGTPYATPGSYSAGVPMEAASDVVGAVVGAQDVVAPVAESQKVFDPPYVPKSEYKNVTTRTYDPDTGNLISSVTGPQLFPSIGPDGQPEYVLSADPSADPKLVPRYDVQGRPIYVQSTDPAAAPTLVPRYDSLGRPIYVPSADPSAEPKLMPRYDKNGRPVYVAGKDPREFSYPQNSFYGYLEAAIQSTSAKTLASPTLLVQEGESAKVETGTSVITGVKATETANGSTQFENTRENAGLTLGVDIEKIDDNGFVTLKVFPSVSIPQEAGFQEGVPIYNITGRSLSSGRVRLRDRQTLVLTGVIRESDIEVVRKWPILGDLPVLGQMFRKTESEREKQELVILVTPSIVDDEAGGAYGYGFRPSTKEARQLMGPS
ncbi:possible general (type II) secretion pathway protein D precursor [Synechococcus sp. RS9916]|nr:possible general (type II) secretion pathway protein D precursor [Synechococcus sp. RS9916]